MKKLLFFLIVSYLSLLVISCSGGGGGGGASGGGGGPRGRRCGRRRAPAGRGGLMSPRVLLPDNYASFTYNLEQALRMLGAEVRVVRNDKMTVAEAADLTSIPH